MTGIIVTFAVVSEGYQAVTELRRAPATAGFELSQASLVRRTDEGLELLDTIGDDEIVLPFEAQATPPGTVCLIALVEEGDEGAFDQSLAHLNVTIRRVDPTRSESERKRTAKRQARHDARIKRLARGLSAIKAKGEAAMDALDGFADTADERLNAADETFWDKVDRMADSADEKIAKRRTQLMSDLDTIAAAVDGDAAATEHDTSA